MAIKKITTTEGKLSYKVTIWSKGKYVESKSFRRLGDAQEWEIRQQTSILDRSVGRSLGENTTINEFFEQVYWPTKTIRPSTSREYLNCYEKHVKPSLGGAKINRMQAEDALNFLSDLVKRGMSPARANRVHTVASAVYRMAIRTGYSKLNPFSGIGFYREEIKGFSYWTKDEVHKFLNWCRLQEKRLFPFYLAAYLTGMRVSELIATGFDCIDFENSLIHVRRSVCKGTREIVQSTKSGRGRTLGLNPTLRAELLKLKAKSKGNLVFTNPDGSRLKYEHIRKWFSRHQQEAGVRKLGIHGIRHTFASHYVMNGGSIFDLQICLGHSDSKVTCRYAHLSQDHLKAQASVVDFEYSGEGILIHIPRLS